MTNPVGYPAGKPRGESSPNRAKARKLKIKGLSYAEIGKRLGVSRQRAQQLVAPTPLARKLARAEMGERCAACGATERKLHLHHDSYESAPSRLLCVPCHRKAHAGTRAVSPQPGTMNILLTKLKRSTLDTIEWEARTLGRSRSAHMRQLLIQEGKRIIASEKRAARKAIK
jgi:hypothetical protein